MGIPAQFNDIIQKHLNVFAAWMPIVSKYSLGDYGIITDGVFQKLGNITEDFQISFNEEPGAEASIDFSSEGASIISTGANAGVNVAPAGDIKANVQIEFSREKSFLVKSPVVTVNNIKNVHEVSKKLRELKDWDGKWKVVHQVFHAQDALIISTIAAGTKINFTGDLTALGQLKLGSANVNIDTNKALGLKINGKSGVIGLGLFRVQSNVFGGWKVNVLSADSGDESHDEPIFLKPDSVKDDL
jgi:hypothetical protein